MPDTDAISPDHPRHELEMDIEALERVSAIADYFAGLARNAGDTANADRIEGEAHILRAWEALLIEAKQVTPHGGPRARG